MYQIYYYFDFNLFENLNKSFMFFFNWKKPCIMYSYNYIYMYMYVHVHVAIHCSFSLACLISLLMNFLQWQG